MQVHGRSMAGPVQLHLQLPCRSSAAPVAAPNAAPCRFMLQHPIATAKNSMFESLRSHCSSHYSSPRFVTLLSAQVWACREQGGARDPPDLSLIHISEPTRLLSISYAVFCLKKKKKKIKYSKVEQTRVK
eukprot:TRINITY_DN15270_c0_g1_i20.p1 TRINITY_DN15270_c0_g1~~TRINITY_DN15270_c0_g1_i20.p1  ORF type:complete len:130 (-),score=21.21 TRINITY_DN15270_c0_g1_i20:26-415(-)